MSDVEDHGPNDLVPDWPTEDGEAFVSVLKWDNAKHHLLEHLSIYISLLGMPGVNVEFALKHVYLPLIKRFLGGERTKSLHDSIMELE